MNTINRMEKVQNFITVCSINYLHYALTLFESIKTNYTSYTFTVFVTDIQTNELTFPPHLDGYKIVCIDEVSSILASDLITLTSYYDILEFNSMMKIYGLYYATEILNFKQCTFLDPDTLLFDSIDSCFMDNNTSIYISPHIIGFNNFDKFIDPLELIYSGLINGGVIHINKSNSSKLALTWLIEKTKFYWFVAPSFGMYADQLWLTILPLLDKEHVDIIDAESCNVAYWNLQGRPLAEKNGKIVMSETGEVLKLFHFSGFPAPYNGRLSKHSNNIFDDETEKVVQNICQKYAISLLKSQENVKNLHLKPSIKFSKETLQKRLKKAEKIWNIQFNTPQISKGFFEKLGNRLDIFIGKISQK